MSSNDNFFKLSVGVSMSNLKCTLAEETNRFYKNEIESLLTELTNNGFDFIVFPIDKIDAHFLLSVQKTSSENIPISSIKISNWISTLKPNNNYSLDPFTRSDLVLPGNSWSNFVIFSMSSWITLDICDVSNEVIKFCSEAFQKQISWASHCGVYSVILPTPSPRLINNEWVCPNYARHVAECLSNYLQTRIWIRIPLIYQSQCSADNNRTMTGSELTNLDGWSVWNHIATIVNKPHLLSVALVLTSIVPCNQKVFERWLAEPIQAVIIPSHFFDSQNSCRLQLPRVYKNFISDLLRHNVQIIVEHNGNLKTALVSPEIEPLGKPYVINYVDISFTNEVKMLDDLKLIHKLLPPLSQAQLFEKPCWDQLQTPLQPLRDNLESQTYETFEQDPVKYQLYNIAIRCCLEDRIASGQKYHTLMVVGGGRGPLVDAALSALKQLNITQNFFTMICLEKNENACITLRSRQNTDNNLAWRSVRIINGDMRHCHENIKVDIMISELLGSFGDNELSPECLDGAQQFLNENGVCIPKSYFSSIEPIMTPKVWYRAQACNANPLFGLNTPHVVKFHKIFYISTEGAKECFSFSHPQKIIKPDNTHNYRYKELKFTASLDSICHGFAGYFHCVLYKDIHFSIHPPTATKHMISWFPLYFPITQPFKVKKNETICVHFWRMVNTYRVWYEWCVTHPTNSVLHNVNAQFHAIHL